MFLDGQKLRPYIPMAKDKGFTGAVDKKKYLERKAFEKRCKELSGKVYTRKATPEELEAAFGKGEN